MALTKFQEELKGNTPVWFTDRWGNIQSGVYLDSMFCCGEMYAVVKFSSGGVMSVPVESLHPTRQDCVNAYNECQRSLTERYKAEIKDINDLVSFCLSHTVSYAEEYTDYAARQAVIERASELGIVIEGVY